MQRWKRRWLWILLACLGVDLFIAWWWWQGNRERNHDAVILAAARRYGVDPALVKAVVWRESRFNARARGRAGEIGLMQVNQLAAEEWAAAERLPLFRHQQLLDPAKNTLAGAWYLAKLLKRYARTDNPIPYALADYNAGRSNVLKWNQGAAASDSSIFIQHIGFPSTRHYVQSILQRHAEYRKTFPPKDKS